VPAHDRARFRAGVPPAPVGTLHVGGALCAVVFLLVLLPGYAAGASAAGVLLALTFGVPGAVLAGDGWVRWNRTEAARKALRTLTGTGAAHDARTVGRFYARSLAGGFAVRDQTMDQARVSGLIDLNRLARRLDDLLWGLAQALADAGKLRERAVARGADTPTQRAAIGELLTAANRRYAQLTQIRDQVHRVMLLRPDPVGDDLARDALARAHGTTVEIGEDTLTAELTVLENLLRDEP